MASSADQSQLTKGYQAYIEDRYDESFEYLYPYEEEGPPKAKFYLAMMYMNGFGIDENLAKAKRLLEEAASKDYLDASVVLGIEYRNGYIFERDLELSRQYFEYAASKNHPQAMNEMGYLHSDDRNGLTPDYSKAFQYFLGSAYNYSGSAAPLAYMYFNGQGIETNLFEAYIWTLIALEFQDRRVNDIYPELEKALTTQEKEKAVDIATERFAIWLKNYSDE